MGIVLGRLLENQAQCYSHRQGGSGERITRELKMNGQKTNDAAVDASDKAEEYLFEFNLHGLTQEEIHISLNGDALYLTGVHTTLSHGGSGLWTERPSGAFVQRLVLPPDSCVNEIQATLQDGVLQVHVPRKAPEDESEKTFIVHAEEPKYEHTPS